jgi:outer membrane receptor for ferrienterochelin and colicin
MLGRIFVHMGAIASLAALLLSAAGAGNAALAAGGEVSGVVRDALERPIPGAEVRLERADGSAIAKGISDSSGRYEFHDIASGTYALVGAKEGFDAASSVVTVMEGARAAGDLVLASQSALDLQVTAERLDVARASIEPRIGSSTYNITNDAIDAQPRGENNPFNQVLLQAPGVAQDSFGQVHIRGEHNALQYRINGIIIPEGISGFGQALSPRFAANVELITGALPAEYGLRTAGVIDITTKSGAFEQGGSLSMFGGSTGTIQPSLEYGGSTGRVSYFVTGDYLQNDLGIEAPTASANPIHDHSEQGHGFAYFSGIIDPTARISAILGTYQGHFEIPNNPNQTPQLGLNVNGQTDFDSATLNENQREITNYGVFAYQKSWDNVDFQTAFFSRFSSLNFTPDPVGDLIFNGVSQDAYRQSIGSGVQTDASYKIFDDHTLRGGFSILGERAIARTTSLVLPTNSSGVQTSTTPESIFDESGKTGWTYSAYLQDEWKLFSNLTINYGGRFDQVYTVTNENQISPRINAVLQATDTTTLHAGYARYFTPPPFELVSSETVSKFINTTAQPQVLTDDHPLAERANYFDAGVSQKILPELRVGIDSYGKFSNNLIDEGQFGAPIILTPFNYRVGRQYGVELTATYDKDNLSAYGNIAFSHAEGKDIVSSQFNFSPDELAFIQNHFIPLDHDQFITASAGAAYLWQGIRFSTDVLYATGLRETVVTPNDGTVTPYIQVNLGVSDKIETETFGKFVLRFDAINLFDRTYQIRNGTGVGVGAPQFGPRRAFYAGLSKEF